MTKTKINAVLLLSILLSATACSLENPTTPKAEASSPTVDNALPSMVGYKNANCGCCQDWVDYVEKSGYAVETIELEDVDPIKTSHGLTDPALKSCHTAIIDGYVIEGHVPVSDIERLLAERPDITGLTAPGMPAMSPGMGSETPENYDVLAFDETGRSSVFSSY